MENKELSNYFESIANLSTIILRKKITTKEIYIILLMAKLLNKDFNTMEINDIIKHLESFFEYSKENQFSNIDDFNKWQNQLTKKLTSTKGNENVNK